MIATLLGGALLSRTVARQWPLRRARRRWTRGAPFCAAPARRDSPPIRRNFNQIFALDAKCYGSRSDWNT